MSETLEVLPSPAVRLHNPDDIRRHLEAASRDVRELASAEGASEELLQILPELGPVFSGFARILSTRAGVVPAGLPADLPRARDQTAPAPPLEPPENV